ncbi:phage virion morphogenesis protein [Candidatus Poribacteria bacterium]|nr:phage virion morphogenesis protein [Candidatus Poribacteria bacterium]
MTIKPVFRLQLKTLPKHLRTNELRLVMIDSMRDYMKEVKRTAQRKLSGEVLNRRTGRLFRSIRTRVGARHASPLHGQGRLRIIGRLSSDVIYARIHEFGGRIRVTPKMRAKLHSIGIHLRSTTQFIKIPKRPYLRTSFEDTQAFGTRLIQQKISRYIQRQLS